MPGGSFPLERDIKSLCEQTQYARAAFEVKEFAESPDYWTVKGIATTPRVDRMDDIVEPMGAKFGKTLPKLYLYHDSERPVGNLVFAEPTAKGIPFEARIPKVKEPGVVKERVEEAAHSLLYKLIDAVSIGFRAIADKVERLKSGGLRFIEWEFLELSLVGIPANPEAVITGFKSLDEPARAASGQNAPAVAAKSQRLYLPRPGVSGTTETKGKAMSKMLDAIKQYEATMVSNEAQIEALVEKSVDEARVLDDEETAKIENLKSDNKRFAQQVAVLKAQAEKVKATATDVPVSAGTNPVAASQLRAGDAVLRPNANLPKGIGLARMAKALCFARINMVNPVDYAKQQWGDSQPEVAEMLQKTAVAAGTTTDSTWASPLVYANNLASEFVDYLRPQTILGKLTGIRRVPFNIRYPIQNGGSTVAWVGQGAPKPVSKLSFTSATMTFAKAAGIVVVTQELARFSSPAAELVIRDDMTAQMVYFLDQQFIDPGVAASANVSPASILNGASNVRQAANTWTTMANVLTDVKALWSTFAANEIALNDAYWIMTPDAAMTLSLILNTGGTAFAFPDLTITGGVFLGIPVIVSNSVPHSVSAGAIVALVKASEIFLADDGGVNITVSGEASLNMDTAPTNNSATPTATSVVSMFQTDSIAIRAERFINWAVRRTYGVGYIDNMHTS